MKFVSLWSVIAAVVILALAAMAYYPGLHGPFVFDDYSNIIHSPATALVDLSFNSLRDALFPLDGNSTGRSLAHLSFALNYYFSGATFNAWDFKVTNLSIHILNAMLLWFIAHRLLARFAFANRLDEMLAGRPWWHWAALLCAIIWVLHPLQLTAVLYVVQRMTSLSALFCLLGLAIWICGRERLEAGVKGGLTRMSFGMFLGLGLGILSKENAVLLPFYALITEGVFFRRDHLSPSSLRALRGFYLLFALLPALLAIGLIASRWDSFMLTYEGRTFTLGERLLSEFRILWYYLQLLIYPNAHQFGIYHDDFAISQGLLSPPTTLIAILAWLVVIGFAAFGVVKQKLFAFSVFWYLIGHSVESSFLGLELIFEHRNYMPTMGVYLAASVYLLRGLMMISDKSVLRFGIPTLLILTLGGVTFSRANIWQDKYVLMYNGVKNHPNSPRYHLDFAVVLGKSGAQDPEIFTQLQSAVRLSPGDVTSLFGMSEVINRRLYKAGNSTPSSTRSMQRIDVRKDPLPADVPSLLAFDDAINKEMLRRAHEEVLITNASELSRYTQRCLNTGNPVCKRMQDKATVWIRALLDNPHQFPEIRAQSELSYAKIIAATDSQEALSAVNRAIHLAPTTIKYRIEKVTLLMALKRLGEADRALNEAEKSLHWSGRNRVVVDLLREQIRAARELSNGQVVEVQPQG